MKYNSQGCINFASFLIEEALSPPEREEQIRARRMFAAKKEYDLIHLLSLVSCKQKLQDENLLRNKILSNNQKYQNELKEHKDVEKLLKVYKSKRCRQLWDV